MTAKQELKVKICGMRESDNILSILELEPDFLGFIFFEKSSRFVSEGQMRDIIKLNFGETERVGVFVDESLENILKYADQGFFNVVQLHGEEPPELVSALKKEGLEVIKVFSVGPDFDPSILKRYSEADYFLFDTKGKLPGGNGEHFDWNLLQQSKINKPFFLSGGLQKEDVDSIKKLGLKNLYAVDFNSKLEESAGVKSRRAVEQLMEQIVHN